jgi:hypothetical protein
MGAALALVCTLILSACSVVRTAEVKPAAGGTPPAAGQVRLVISRDFGARVLKDLLVPAVKGMTVMQVLAEHASVDTKYGGGFVQGIDGLASSFAGSSATAVDWFYWVDGVMGSIGATDYVVRGGQTVWWDYHRWANAMFIPAALAAFPAPFKNGGGLTLTVESAADGAQMQATTQSWARRENVPVHAAPRSYPSGANLGPRLIVGTPARVAAGLAGSFLSRGTAAGVFATVDHGRLYALRADGSRGPQLLAAALAVPDPSQPSRLWLVLIADDAAALSRLLDNLTPKTADAHVALGLTSTGVVPLPFAPRNATRG